MAKGLKSLIRLNEWKVDEKRRVLGEKLSQVMALEDGLSALEAELVQEQSKAALSPQEAGLYYGNYVDGVISRRTEFEAQIEEMEQQVLVAQDDLNESYRELKKFEILHKEREKREEKERDKKEQDLLDELGLQGFQRNAK